MKQELTINDLLSISDNEILNISKYLGSTWMEWNTTDHVFDARYAYTDKGLKHNSLVKIVEKFTGLRMIGLIREYHQIDLYTVNEKWCIQLFDLNDCANDQNDCSYEDNNTELIDLLFDCVKWLNDSLKDS